MTNVLAQAVSAGTPAAWKGNPKTCTWPDGHATSCLARTWLELNAHSVNTLCTECCRHGISGTRDRIKTMMVVALLVTIVIVILARTSLPACGAFGIPGPFDDFNFKFILTEQPTIPNRCI